MQGTKKVAGYRTPVGSPKALPLDTHPWYFNPNRSSVRRPSDHFMRELRAFDPDLDCTWHPHQERWAIWMRTPRIQTAICSGWSLLFFVHPAQLDARVFARLYGASARRWNSGREYFAAIEREFHRDKERAERARQQETLDIAMPHYDHSQISVSMRGQSNGSKFADYHS